jgi:hypothetical protein
MNRFKPELRRHANSSKNGLVDGNVLRVVCLAFNHQQTLIIESLQLIGDNTWALVQKDLGGLYFAYFSGRGIIAMVMVLPPDWNHEDRCKERAQGKVTHDVEVGSIKLGVIKHKETGSLSASTI